MRNESKAKASAPKLADSSRLRAVSRLTNSQKSALTSQRRRRRRWRLQRPYPSSVSFDQLFESINRTSCARLSHRVSESISGFALAISRVRSRLLEPLTRLTFAKRRKSLCQPRMYMRETSRSRRAHTGAQPVNR